MRATLKELGLKPTGGNYKHIQRHISLLKLDTGHWKGKGYLKGENHNWGIGKPLKEILVKNSNYVSTWNLKLRLMRNGLLTNKCDICGIDSWLGKPLAIQLDHINGINNDHRIENLRMLCPNCHSQTDTFTGRNLKNK